MLKPAPLSPDNPRAMLMTPDVAVAAMLTARRRGLRLREWLDQVVIDAVSAAEGCGGQAPDALTDATVSLFVRTASRQPDLLEGHWKLLYERVWRDDSLWSYPSQTVCDFEAGVRAEPMLDEAQLRRRWPELVAASLLSRGSSTPSLI